METRKLTRSRGERVIAGVAGGLGAYLNVDPLLVRLVFVFLAFANGLGLLIYLLLWLLVPNSDSLTSDSREVIRENLREMQAAAEQLIARVQNMFNNSVRS